MCFTFFFCFFLGGLGRQGKRGRRLYCHVNDGLIRYGRFGAIGYDENTQVYRLEILMEIYFSHSSESSWETLQRDERWCGLEPWWTPTAWCGLMRRRWAADGHHAQLHHAVKNPSPSGNMF
ncbi:uncharacterized protein BP01DRAFT_113444 [Aspergillus saccharolyticus JOP 1030-1]|uniref:Secreted protein n=1 Tax=Aspergillus saccharolyticus JOP 1030-1 TaxID=1450539 RepID=A0A318ZQI7_9EURO|nr:hypothetical protein BP01DRAFT_113444 [Aspergillus saccharolyticus JOP 1030-1]PYH48814.1 hypothetical protein BP01DRAFT_113444 [Aspergillus saccharolyticus JOP 1030-1]